MKCKGQDKYEGSRLHRRLIIITSNRAQEGCPVHLERYIGGIMAAARAAITRMKVAQIPQKREHFEIVECNYRILLSLRPSSAQKPLLDNKNDMSKIANR